MIRLITILLFIFFSLHSATSVDKKIKSTSSKIDQYSKSHKNISKKVEQNAKDILKQQEEIDNQEKYLESLRSELASKESSYNENTKMLVELTKVQDSLKKNSDSLEQELVFTIAQSVSLSIILEEDYTSSEESMIEFEVLQAMLKKSKAKIKDLNERFYQNSIDISKLSNQATALEEEISSIDAKRRNLLETQEKNKKDLQNLKIAKTAYKKELKKLLEKQDILKQTLSQLNIIKIDEINKAKEEEARKKAFEEKAVILDADLPTVKKHGSSYQEVKTKNYTGAKTIAPFNPYTITKKYGTYTDPIYGIKVFNESISLKPDKENTKVQTVFNGKVIYADKTAVLDNIVIIEHTNGLHTIYANLSQISPDIKKGKKVKKGYTIGRVSSELIFEVTQKSFHINPVRLFQ